MEITTVVLCEEISYRIIHAALFPLYEKKHKKINLFSHTNAKTRRTYRSFTTYDRVMSQ